MWEILDNSYLCTEKFLVIIKKFIDVQNDALQVAGQSCFAAELFNYVCEVPWSSFGELKLACEQSWTFTNMIVCFFFCSIYRHLILKKDNTISKVFTLMWYVTGFRAFFSFIGSKISLESAAVPQWCSQRFPFSWPNTSRKVIRTFSVYFSAPTRIIFIYF